MPPERTQTQSADEQQAALEMSQRRIEPPAKTPGYQLRRFLGAGAYGEVWVGVDETTGRQVAVKFYTHKGGVDWSLLHREVEKLVFLSADRYVVQLLDVGWDAEPPYYVMDYIENGSLDDLLQNEGTLAGDTALVLFREVALGLRHAHGKGVLHCDLKPGNVLLDQDRNPRLADFGQSRLSHEQTPALGTLFYMAPEQADLKAVPDARWDVYALGALFYCMVTGEPPHRNEEIGRQIEAARTLEDRLSVYRHAIETAPPATLHRQAPEVDGMLADIIDRCLAAQPKKRFSNVQEVLNALQARESTRARRPLLMLGVIGPLLLLTVMGLFAWRGFDQAVSDSRKAVTESVRQSNHWAAQFAAGLVAKKLQLYYTAVERTAADPSFQQLLERTVSEPEIHSVLEQLPTEKSPQNLAQLRRVLTEHMPREELQAKLDSFLDDPTMPPVATWFVVDRHGNSLAIVFEDDTGRSTVGENFAYRSYFHGGPNDLSENVPVSQIEPIRSTHLSALFPSKATNVWKVAVSTPIKKDGEVLGVLAMTVEMGTFMRFPSRESQFAVLVDGRPGDTSGVILQHPLFEDVLAQQNKLPDRFARYRVPMEGDWSRVDLTYRDPLGTDPLGAAYDKEWIAALASVNLEASPSGTETGEEHRTGLYVLVQEGREEAVAPITVLGGRLVREALAAVAVILVLVGCLWYFVLRSLSEKRFWGRGRGTRQDTSLTPLNEMETILATGPVKKR
jgi:eukaryotic-like serine/threonine-protein kinase